MGKANENRKIHKKIPYIGKLSITLRTDHVFPKRTHPALLDGKQVGKDGKYVL